MASETNHGDHEAHAKGLAALMKVDPFPLNLLGTVRSAIYQHSVVSRVSHFVIKSKVQVNANGWHLQVSGVFSVPALSEQGESLDSLLVDLYLLWTKFQNSQKSKDFFTLRNESILLDQRFAKWQESRVTEFKPTGIGHISRKENEMKVAVGYWPGKVDTYFDLYVAGVWNIFRVARLQVVDLIIKLSDALEVNDGRVDHIHTAHCIVEDMLASIPYHLVDNLQAFLNEVTTSIEITDRGRSLGGLFLMHPIYVASKMPFLPNNIREYIQRCLIWIGSHMGLGQATLLAKVRDFGT
jgi:hypothetical protein